MSLRIVFDESTLEQHQTSEPKKENGRVGWPTNTWFQKRLRYLRAQQRRKVIENDIIYRCALGTIIVRQSNNGD